MDNSKLSNFTPNWFPPKYQAKYFRNSCHNTDTFSKRTDVSLPFLCLFITLLLQWEFLAPRFELSWDPTLKLGASFENLDGCGGVVEM